MTGVDISECFSDFREYCCGVQDCSSVQEELLRPQISSGYSRRGHSVSGLSQESLKFQKAYQDKKVMLERNIRKVNWHIPY